MKKVIEQRRIVPSPATRSSGSSETTQGCSLIAQQITAASSLQESMLSAFGFHTR